MKRSEFLKRLGLGIAAIPLAPQIVAATKEAFDGAGTNTLMNDEVGKFPSVEDTMEIWKETGDLVYSHYEEPWVHKMGWPFRINDQILTDSEKAYVVTEIHQDPITGEQIVTATPYDGRDPEIKLTRENGKNVIIFGNLNSHL